MILERIKESRLNFSHGNVPVLWKMANYEDVKVKLTSNQFKKLKSLAKNKTGTTLITAKKDELSC